METNYDEYSLYYSLSLSVYLCVLFLGLYVYFGKLVLILRIINFEVLAHRVVFNVF